MTSTALAAALQGAVAAVPALLADAGPVNTLAVFLAPGVAELDITESSGPARVTDTGARHTGPVRSTVQTAHTEAALRSSPVVRTPGSEWR